MCNEVSNSCKANKYADDSHIVKVNEGDKSSNTKNSNKVFCFPGVQKLYQVINNGRAVKDKAHAEVRSQFVELRRRDRYKKSCNDSIHRSCPEMSQYFKNKIGRERHRGEQE